MRMDVEPASRMRFQNVCRQNINALATANRHYYQTAEAHCIRVGKYALAIGKVVGLSPEELVDLKYAAALHDIGKIAISRRILGKLGKLTEEEIEIMRRHYEVCLRLLEKIDELRLATVLVRYHHERFDGKGYPAGLSGISIPLGSRIIAVAEAFDILTCNVPWRRAMDKKSALDELQRCAGTQFDPEVVEALRIAVTSSPFYLKEYGSQGGKNEQN
jgi:response regulator RpfG family c-di-GMP phosphodiesterase